jgi:hypothetical protein
MIQLPGGDERFSFDSRVRAPTFVKDFYHPLPSAVFDPDSVLRNIRHRVIHSQFRNRVRDSTHPSSFPKGIFVER